MDLLRRIMAGFWPAPLVAGLLFWMSFAPVDIGWSQPLGWAVLLASLRVRRGAKAARQGYVAGLVLFFPGLHWMAPLVFAGWIFSALWCALFPALTCGLLARFWLRRREGQPAAGWIVGAGLLAVLADLVRGVLLTGFPWLLPGTAGWYDPVLLSGAGLIGVHGVTFFFVALGAGVAEIVARAPPVAGLRRRLRPLYPAALVYAAFLVWFSLMPVTTTIEAPGPVVALLQANVPQQNKEQVLAELGAGADDDALDAWWREHLRTWWKSHEDLLAQVRQGHSDVVVWPETMVPPWPRRARRDLAATPDLWRRLADLAGDRYTLAGVARGDEFGRGWNSVVLVDPSGQAVAAQDKQHLTPGGEYIPYADVLPFGDELLRVFKEEAGFDPLTPGDGRVVLEIPFGRGDGQAVARVGVLVCYESVFPSISRAFVLDGADLLVNVSNYGWFVGTAEMEQALAMACMRSAEVGIPMVTASNNGISAVIDCHGHPAVVLTDGAGHRADFAGVLEAPVGMSHRRTPFRLWGEFPAWLLGISGLILGSVVGRRPASP